MNPKLFGRGSWYFLFFVFYEYFEKEQKEICSLKNNIVSKKNIDENFEERIRINNLESLKKKINIMIEGLPCDECRMHTKIFLNKNNIYNSTSMYYIFHFFIELRNSFYENKIQRSMFDNPKDCIKNKELFFNILATG